MEAYNYKNLLQQLNKKTPVAVTISLWTYSSKRIRRVVAFDQIAQYVDGDMHFKHRSDGKLLFTDISGEAFSFNFRDLKIAKVDSVAMPPAKPKGADSE